MFLLDYQKHPFLIATILAVIIALLNYITLSFFSNYAELIFEMELPTIDHDPLFHDHFHGDYHEHAHHHLHSHLPQKLFALKQMIANFLLAFILYIVNFYIYGKLTIAFQNQIALSIVLTIIITSTFCLLSIYLDIYLRSIDGHLFKGPRLMELIRSSITRDTIVANITIFSSILMYHIKKQEIAKLENEALIAENIRSRYNALTAKLDPHFLFNSLNTLKALIKLDPAKAQKYTQQLSEIFRYTINHKDVISLKEEIDFSRAYGDMILMRYENNLHIIYNVEEKYFNYNILPFCIQALIENAIKHNTITTKKPLSIEIYNDDEYIIVQNKKSPKKEQELTSGFGLKNLNDRYKYQFKREIEILNSDDEFIVKVPIIKVEN